MEDLGEKEVLLIRYIWKKGTNSIHSMHTVNTAKILISEEKTKKGTLDRGERKEEKTPLCLPPSVP